MIRLVDGLGPQDVLQLKAGPDRPGVTGYFSMVARERGKIVPGSRREGACQVRQGSNVWTVTGRSFLAYQITPLALGGTDDRVTYMGLGSGALPEVASVLELQSPLPYSPNLYKKAIVDAEFPNDPPTSVAFICEFEASNFSYGGNVELREAGLFLASAVVGVGTGAPVAYKNFEPLTKTSQFRLEIRWEIRFR